MSRTAPPVLRPGLRHIGWLMSLPFFVFHILAVVGVVLVGFRWEWLLLCAASYVLRMWGVTAGYHRYFSHRSFRTSRAFQFLLAFLAQTSAQKGALWWAAHHRDHHRYSDAPNDVHSPRQHGFWWAHVGWILDTRTDETRWDNIRDLARFPELRLLNRFPHLPAVIYGVAIWAVGGWGALVWGMLVSTVLLWHGTFTINSLTHIIGRRRYETTDDSRNHWLLALITLGEGWHNNHHHYQSSTRQGFFWWEYDFTYYALKALSWVGLVWDLRGPSEAAKWAHKRGKAEKPARTPLAMPSAAKAGDGVSMNA